MKRSIVHRSAAAAVTLAALGLATLTAAGTASAADATVHTTTGNSIRPQYYGEFTDYVTTDGVNIREGASTNTAIYGQANTGEALDDYCYTTGTNIGGDVYWDWIQDTATGVGGFVSEYYLTVQSQTQPC
jgi:hypothetical protein